MGEPGEILPSQEPHEAEASAIQAKNDQSTAAAQENVVETTNDSSSVADAVATTGQNDEAAETNKPTANLSDPADNTYYWCKCPCDPAQYMGASYYYLHLQTSESRWEEPNEPYWLFDPTTGRPDPDSLQQPKSKAAAIEPSNAKEGGPTADYQGYNPKIHGKYDPKAPYAKYHEQKRKEEEAAEYRKKYGDSAGPRDYALAATFNRFTGAFQTADKSVERHSDASKSHRQLSAFYDVDAAANAHDGQSLKAARQQQKFTKKEIAEMNARRKEKKMKKRLDWLKS